MNHEEWKYKLTMEVSSEGWKFDRIMHFEDLKSAFYMLADCDLDCYSSNPNPHNIPTIKNVSVSDRDGVNKVVVQIDSKDVEQNGVNIPGQFYIFPNGAASFEHEACLSLASFKGYSPKQDFVLAAYTVQETNDILLASTGLKLLRESIPAFKQENLPFQLSFNHKSFVNDGRIRSRQLAETIKQDIFHYKEIASAFSSMLDIDYDRMEENLAWDKDLNGYFSGIHLGEVKPDGTGYKTFSAVNYQHTTYYHPKGKAIVNGVVLSIHTSYLDRIDLTPLKPVTPDFESRRLLARLNPTLTKMNRVKGLDILLNCYKNKAELKKQAYKAQPSRRVLSPNNKKGNKI